MVGATAVSLLCATTTVITLSAPAAGASGLNTLALRARPRSGDDRRGRLHCRHHIELGHRREHLDPLGSVPGLFQGAPYGVEAYFDYINSKGGVNGRQLKVDSYDDAFSGQSNESETTTRGQGLRSRWQLLAVDSYGCKVLAANPAVADVS